jgi:ABC-type Fe3+/spermidine/putrescine transport system ATPase subunit
MARGITKRCCFLMPSRALHVRYVLTAPIALNVQFEVRGFTALLGASGAGKTSLLKALAGLLPAAGAPWNAMPAQARPVGYMPQGLAVFPHLSVLENVAFALRGKQRLPQAQKLLDDLGIGDLAARNGAKISGGEAQRVALARALARQPELLLLDEPSAALDAATRDTVVAQLIESIEASGIPALAATHDPAIAMLADWLVLLADGHIIQQGTPRELLNRPETIAAARLLGYQNFWMEGGKSCCIRAEDIEISKGGIEAVITGIREQGMDLRLTCLAPETLVVLIRDDEKSGFSIGQNIQLGFPKEKVRILKGAHNPYIGPARENSNER